MYMKKYRVCVLIIVLITIIFSCTKMISKKNATANNKILRNSTTVTTIKYDYKSPINLRKYKGLYLPEQYISILKITYSHNRSLSRLKTDAAFLDIREDHIESNSNFHDGFWIERNRIEKYSFTNSNEGIIIDELGNTYIKIPNLNKDVYKSIEMFISSLLFKGKKYYSDGKSLIGNTDGSIEINGEKYYLGLDIVFMPRDIDVYRSDEGKVCGIRADKEKVEVIKLESDPEDLGYNDTREVLETYYLK